MNTTRTRYTRTAIVLHWVLGLAIVGSFCMGVYMADLPFSPQRLKLYNWHKWAGVTVLVLTPSRLVVAHADDVALFIGGTVAAWAEARTWP